MVKLDLNKISNFEDFLFMFLMGAFEKNRKYIL